MSDYIINMTTRTPYSVPYESKHFGKDYSAPTKGFFFISRPAVGTMKKKATEINAACSRLQPICNGPPCVCSPLGLFYSVCY